MKWRLQSLLMLMAFISVQPVMADGLPTDNLIPELSEIEQAAKSQEDKLKAEEKTAMKAVKAEQDAKKAAAKVAEATPAVSSTQVTPMAGMQPIIINVNTAPQHNTTTTSNKPKAPKATAKPIAKVDPWLAQERQYTFP
jgi:L-serine deaminase